MSKSKQLTLPACGKLVHPNVLLQGKGFWEKKVVWDLHGVIVDWMTPFYRFVNKVYGRNIDIAQITTYYAGYDAKVNLNPAEFDEMFKHFAGLARGGYGDLKPYPGVVEAMNKIDAAGIEQAIWSWTPGSSDIALSHSQPFHTCPAQGETLDLIKRLKLPVDLRPNSGGVMFVHSSAKAPEMANQHLPLLIEDHGPTAISAVHDFGIAAMLCTQGYNKATSDERIIRWGQSSNPAEQDRTGIEVPVIEFFKELEEAEALIGSER